MIFEKIYVQDNFVPDYCTDPFRRKVIGTSIIIQEGETKEQAVEAAHQFIEEYIKANTVTQPPKETILAQNPVEEANYTTHIPKQPVNKKEALINGYIGAINTCTDLKTLEIYDFLSKNYPEIREAYEAKLTELKG